MQRSAQYSMVLGRIEAGRDNAAVQGLTVRLSPYQLRDNMPSLGLHGVVSRPLPGSQAVVLLAQGDPSNGVVIAVNDPRHYVPDMPDGTVGHAHHLGNRALLFADTIQIHGSGETLRKLVTDVFRELFNGHTHPTPSGTSGPPSQQLTDAHLTGVLRAGGP